MIISRFKKALFITFISWQIQANINGVDTQLFKPTSNGLDFLTVHSTSVLPPFTFNTGLFFNGSFNSLLVSENKRSYSADDVLLSSDINVGFGVYKNIELGFNAPSAIYHHSDQSLQGLHFEENGFLDLSFNLKYSFFRRNKFRNWGLAVIPSINVPIVEDPYFVGYDGTPIFNLEFAFDYQFTNFIFGLNVGYRLRNPGDDMGREELELIDDQALASIALSYFNNDISTGFIFELYGATEVNNSFDTERTPLEALLAIKYNPKYNFSLIAGGAIGLSVSIGNPDYRFFSGINYNFGFTRKDEKKIKEFEVDLNEIEKFTPEGGELKVIITEDKVNFIWNDFRLSASDKLMLDKIAYKIKTNPKISSLHVVGHTDSSGAMKYNKWLSEKRANAVKFYLIQSGVSKIMLSTSGRGEEKPIADNSTYIGRAKNRRVELIIK